MAGIEDMKGMLSNLKDSCKTEAAALAEDSGKTQEEAKRKVFGVIK